MENKKTTATAKKNADKKITTTGGTIDREVLDIMSQEDILTAISDQKQANRLILNCFMEFLSELRGLRDDMDTFVQVISICSKDKIDAFFKQVQSGLSQEETRIAVQDKIKQSHKKSTKKSNKSAK